MSWIQKLTSSSQTFISSFTANFRGLRKSKEINKIDKPVISSEERKKIFRQFLTARVTEGWSLEIENEFDAVLSRKARFRWFGKLIIFLILLLLFAPLALFYLIVVIIRGVTARPSRLHISIDEFGDIQPPIWRDIVHWKML